MCGAAPWRTVTRKLKQIVYDLRTLRNLATYLLRYDAVTFLRCLETLRVAEGRESLWLFTAWRELYTHTGPPPPFQPLNLSTCTLEGE